MSDEGKSTPLETTSAYLFPSFVRKTLYSALARIDQLEAKLQLRDKEPDARHQVNRTLGQKLEIKTHQNATLVEENEAFQRRKD